MALIKTPVIPIWNIFFKLKKSSVVKYLKIENIIIKNNVPHNDLINLVLVLVLVLVATTSMTLRK